MLPLLSALLLLPMLTLAPPDGPRPQQPSLRLGKSFRLQVKPKPTLAAAPQQVRERPGAVVEVLGDSRPLESIREQTLREFRDWIVANRFHGSAFVPALQPAFMSTASWEQTHPGGFTVAPMAPLGWGY